MAFAILALPVLLLLSCREPLSTSVQEGTVVDQVRITKSKRELVLLSGEKVIRRYKVALGWAPIGPKEREGDGKTPEGVYKISGRNPNSSFHLSLRVSYPNKEDIRRATKRTSAEQDA